MMWGLKDVTDIKERSYQVHDGLATEDMGLKIWRGTWKKKKNNPGVHFVLAEEVTFLRDSMSLVDGKVTKLLKGS